MVDMCMRLFQLFASSFEDIQSAFRFTRQIQDKPSITLRILVIFKIALFQFMTAEE